MRAVLVIFGLLLSACATQQAVAPQVVAPQAVAPADPAPIAVVASGYAPIAAAQPLFPPAQPGFQAMLASHGVPLSIPVAGKAIIVNIPSAEVVALQDGVEVMRSRVIVGKPSRRTPLMQTATTVVRFRPHWRPTPSMIASGAYEDKVVPPGRRNPLGAAAIRLEGGDMIYLHGTNRPDLFARDARALSWGCVRVEDLEPLLAWLLDVTPAQVAAWTAGPRSVDAPTDGVPVVITYQTRFPDADGVLRDWPDVYGHGGAQVASR